MNFVELMNRYDIPILESGHHHCRSGWVQVHCPFCDVNQSHFHMGYNLEYKYVNCWKCGPHELYYTLLKLLPRVKVPQIKRFIRDLPQQRSIQLEIKRNLSVPQGLRDLTKRFKRYLKNRKYNTQTIQNMWGVSCFSTLRSPSEYHNRLFIPITLAGEVVSWTTRSILPDAKLRYLSASAAQESIPHKSLLYGEDYARHAIIITEGPLDVWKIGPGAVATFGTNFTPDQVYRMSKYPRRIICFDKETTAQNQAMKLTKQLSVFPGITANVKLEAADPGAAEEDELNEIRKFAFS